MLQDMMNSKVRKIVVIVGTTALFGAAAGTTNATAAGGAAQQQGTPAGRAGGPPAVVQAEAEAGHGSSRPPRPTPTRPSGPRRWLAPSSSSTAERH
jgi:hypothetical protein